MKSYDEKTEVRNETPLRQLTDRDDNLFFVAEFINESKTSSQPEAQS